MHQCGRDFGWRLQIPFERLSGLGRSTQAGPHLYVEFDSRNPHRNRRTGVMSGKVTSGPVTRFKAGCMDGDPPPGLQGSLQDRHPIRSLSMVASRFSSENRLCSKRGHGRLFHQAPTKCPKLRHHARPSDIEGVDSHPKISCHAL